MSGKSHPAAEHDVYRELLRKLTTHSVPSHHCPLAIGLAGCQRGDGATTIAANLAMTASRMWSNEILLIDANVYHPSIDQLFQITPPKDGLVHRLQAGQSASECVFESSTPRLSLMPTAKMNSISSTSIPSLMVKEMLDSLKHCFDFIIIDLPPIHATTPGYAIAPYLDGVVLVSRANVQHCKLINASARVLRDINAHVLGAVYNHVSPVSTEQSHISLTKTP